MTPYPAPGLRYTSRRGVHAPRQTETIAMDKPLYVHAEWDAEAGVWVATSNDVPGLATEAETVEALIAKLETMIPELLTANGATVEGAVLFELLARRFDHVRPAA